jgi:type III restriction enzyme
MAFASFLDDAPDVAAFAKNYLAVGFKIDYVKADGDLSNYVPDFLVKTTDGTVWVVETKGREERDLPQKMNRLRQWCANATQASQAEGGPAYRFVYVDQAGYERNPPKDFAGLSAAFRSFQEHET